MILRKIRPFDNRKFRSHYPFKSREVMIITLLECANRPVVKSELLFFIDALFWPGHVSSEYIWNVRRTRIAFNLLVLECVIEYKKGKPIVLADAQKTLDS